jgi:hypothetical protein
VVPAPLWHAGHSAGQSAIPISISQLLKYEDPHEVLVSK